MFLNATEFPIFFSRGFSAQNSEGPVASIFGEKQLFVQMLIWLNEFKNGYWDLTYMLSDSINKF